jgi:uncharacterized membrane protein YcfT
MTRHAEPSGKPDVRSAWIDAAKGLCIILVVLFHSTLGVEKELGALTWMNPVIEWARPFRMPDFFLISGLFLGARIAWPWRTYLDTKVVHFAYFYVLWYTIHFAVRIKGTLHELGAVGALKQYLLGYVDPFGSLWFIYLLAVFCVVAKLLYGRPAWLVTGLGLAAHVLVPHTGIFIADEFVSRFVFFYVGYAYAPLILNAATQVASAPRALILAGLGLWAVANTLGLVTGLAAVPVFELVFGAAGIAAVIATCVVLTSARARLGDALVYCGKNSIVIYLAFTLFMGPARTLLLKFAPGLNGGVTALVCATAGLAGALVLHRLVRHTTLAFLFERPATFRTGVRATVASRDRRPVTV